MKKNFINGMMATALLFAFGACSQELDTVRNDAAEEGVVRVAFGSTSLATRAVGDEVTEETDKATTDEKTVTSLYVMVFKDVSEATNTTADKSKSTAADNDTFVKMIELLSDDLNTDNSTYAENTDYFFKLGAGNYQFCFVANPGMVLLESLESVKTVADFKKLTVIEDPSAKPMLMTSDYFGGAVTNEGLDLTDFNGTETTVVLTRAMARIDIVNKASGVTISKVTLKNRASYSTLETSTTNPKLEDWVYDANTTIGSDAPYSGKLPLVGNAVADESGRYPEYDKVIYSYEQLNTTENLPSIVITYSVYGVSGTVDKEIPFETTEGEKIVLKRNWLYTINVTNTNGKINFTLTVKDWEEGTTFVKDGDALRGGYTED